MCMWIQMIEEGYFEYGNFEFENGNFFETKWGTKSKVGTKSKPNLT